MTTNPLSVLIVASDHQIIDVIKENLTAEMNSMSFTLCETIDNARTQLEVGGCNLVLVPVADADAVNRLNDSLYGAEFLRFVPVITTYEARLIDALHGDFADYLCLDQLDHISMRRISRLFQPTTEPLSMVELTVAHNVDATLVLDRQGNILLANQVAEQLFGQSRDRLERTQLGVPIVTNESVELNIVRKDDELITAELRANSVQYQGKTAYLATLRDITDRKQIENRLREAEALSHSILNSLQMIIAVLDEDGVIIKVNDAWLNFAIENGDPDLENTGVGVNYFDTVRRSVRKGQTPSSLQGMLDVLHGKSPSFEYKYPCHSPNEQRWFLMRVTPLDSDEYRGLVVAHINISLQHSITEKKVDKAIQNERDERRVDEEYDRQLASLHEFTQHELIDDNHTIEEPIQQLYREFGMQYKKVLVSSLERRAYKVEYNISSMVRELAIALGKQTIRPRELVRLHLLVIEQSVMKLPVVKRKAYENEGRIILLELMGYLATFYRDNLITSLELQNL